MKIRVFTDGACSENPGPGGWGSILMYKENKNQRIFFPPIGILKANSCENKED